MSFSENFDTGTGSYTITAYADGWINTTGYPAAGCCKFALSVVLAQGLQNSVDNLSITTATSFWFYYRVTDGQSLSDSFSILDVDIAFSLGANRSFSLTGADVNTSDTGWVLVEITIPASYIGDEITDIFVSIGSPPSFDLNAAVYVDTFLIDPDPPETSLSYGLGRSAGGIPGAVMI